ncbi:MAG TPA: YihY family inner membrane protein [Pseudomonas sp.]|jgi:membrane protein|nr:YihY family inner membrane protein [Pseudomonas sp.]
MRQWLANVVEFWGFLVRRFLDDKGLDSAASLTYTTLFAVVPTMTVTFSIISMVPAFHELGGELQNFIFRNFVPSTGATLLSYLTAFSEQARQLTWVGVIFLVVTALMMMLTIEKAFNTIWRVRQPRRGVSSFLIYWAILSLGPLLLGAGFAISTYVASLAMLAGPDALFDVAWLIRSAPLLLEVAAFTLLYAVVPNTRVPLRHALAGGLFSALLVEAAKKLFSLYVGAFPTYQLIYGAFATVPLFLLWIYVCWLIVLLGAELACNLSSPRAWRARPLPRLLAALGVLRILQDRQRKGATLRYRQLRREGWPLPEEEWHEILAFLQRERLVCPTTGNAWVLCRDLNSYPLERLLARSPWSLPPLQTLPETLPEPWYPDLRAGLLELEQAREAIFHGNLGDWLSAGHEETR